MRGLSWRRWKFSIKWNPIVSGATEIVSRKSTGLDSRRCARYPCDEGLDGVSDAEITALAKYYEEKTLAPVPTDKDAEVFARGGKLAEGMRCGICHLPTYLGREQIPRLAGQREDYLLHSMQQFKNNQAVGRDSNMAASVYGVSDQDLNDISYYLARLTP